jgi:hypothetical protein
LRFFSSVVAVQVEPTVAAVVELVAFYTQKLTQSQAV